MREFCFIHRQKKKMLLTEREVLVFIAGLLLPMSHSIPERNERQPKKPLISGYLDRKMLFPGVI
jgi:hypothetical protein